jgi:arginase family enzyme
MKKEPLILGMPFDNGIRSMLHLGRGIIGASDAPQFIFDLIDKNNIKIDKKILSLNNFNIDINKSLEEKRKATDKAHKSVEKFIIKNKDKFLISIGGDHSLTYPIFKSLSKYKKMSLLLLDAHFDMRSHIDEGFISSGNSFYRILNENLTDKMFIYGINKNDSEDFKKQLNFALKNNVKIIKHFDLLDNVLSKSSYPIYLSIDIDVLDEKYAPGVSARNKKGLSEKQFFKILDIILKYNIIAIDIMETSSRNNDFKSLNKTSEIIIKIIKKIKENYKY